MTVKDLTKWNKWASMVYALGVWTMVGSYAFLKYTGRLDEKVAQTPSEVKRPDDVGEIVYSSAHMRTVVTYKKDFVPYTTRLYNFIKSFSGGTGTGGDEK